MSDDKHENTGIVSELISAARRTALVWGMVWLMAFLFLVDTFATATVTVLYGVEWANLTTQEKIVCILLIAKSMTSVLIAFTNKSVARVAAGQLPDFAFSVTEEARIRADERGRME